jgi:hypothetical protein
MHTFKTVIPTGYFIIYILYCENQVIFETFFSQNILHNITEEYLCIIVGWHSK